MSRHTIKHTDPNRSIVVGYDRPTGAYFCQVWEKGTIEEPVYIDYCFDPDELESLGAIVPDGLRETLRNEVIGESDTNTVKDWR